MVLRRTWHDRMYATCRVPPAHWPRNRIDMSPRVPYVPVRSQDVLTGSLDLVLRLCTHVDAVWCVLRRPHIQGSWFFLLFPDPARRRRARHASQTRDATIHQPVTRWKHYQRTGNRLRCHRSDSATTAGRVATGRSHVTTAGCVATGRPVSPQRAVPPQARPWRHSGLWRHRPDPCRHAPLWRHRNSP